jgi:hypothetical protein
MCLFSEKASDVLFNLFKIQTKYEICILSQLLTLLIFWSLGQVNRKHSAGIYMQWDGHSLSVF